MRDNFYWTFYNMGKFISLYYYSFVSICVLPYPNPNFWIVVLKEEQRRLSNENQLSWKLNLVLQKTKDHLLQLVRLNHDLTINSAIHLDLYSPARDLWGENYIWILSTMLWLVIINPVVQWKFPFFTMFGWGNLNNDVFFAW